MPKNYCETCGQDYCSQSRECVKARGYAERICESCGFPESAGPLKRAEVRVLPGEKLLLCKECLPRT